MTQAIEQLGQSQNQSPSLRVEDWFPIALPIGLLDNEQAQGRPGQGKSGMSLVLTQYAHQVGTRLRDSKLAMLKRKVFTPERREERIRASLAALNSPQLINLTLAQWKTVAEEMEDDDEE